MICPYDRNDVFSWKGGTKVALYGEPPPQFNGKDDGVSIGERRSACR